MKGQDKESGKAIVFKDTPYKNRFYALCYRGEQNSLADVVTGLLKVISIDVSVLLNLGTTLSFFSSLIDLNFDILTDILNEPFMVSISVEESVVANRVCRNCSIMFPYIVTSVELIEHDVFYFDVILGMDWLNACFASIDYRTRVVRFNFQNKTFLEWKGVNSLPRGHIICFLKACKMISKECLYHKGRVQDLDSKNPPI